MRDASSAQEQAIRTGIGKRDFSWEYLELGEPVALPPRVLGFEIDWMLAWDNSPELKLTLTLAPPEEDFLFEEVSPGLYMAVSAEGFVQWHFHNGKPEKQEGYGGRHFALKMKDGSVKTLKGPWHGGPPKGTAEVHYKEVNGQFPDLGYFGLAVTFPLLAAIRDKFKPDIRFCSIGEYGGKYIEPVSPKFGLPKKLVPALMRGDYRDPKYPRME